jgi:acid phosphatase type 7
VTVDDVSDTLIGPSDTGTDVTWHADEDGAYSVRVGGGGCASGDEVESGSYTGAPTQHITIVSASDLNEGANTIRICVIDAAGNQGSQTTNVVKDVNPPLVAIDAVSDSLVGPAAPASDITWQASESGTYSVRVGGAGCTTGSVVAGGSYGGPPDQRTTTVSTDDLTEGPNTIRVCVTDAGGSHGSQTTTLVKDTTAPAVTVDGISDPLIGPDDPSTDVTWHAEENGAYGVRAGGGACTKGTEVETGAYTGAPAQHITTVSAGDLSEGENTIRICVTDTAGNQNSQTTTVAKDTAERVTLTFSPQADARVEEASPDTNFGTSTSLRVEAGSALDIESYLRFQVTGVLGTVEQAKLRLWVSNGTPDGPAAYKTDWAGAETAITWNDRAPRTSGPTDDKGNVPVNAYVEYDVTSLVSGNGANGFVLAGTSSDAMTVPSRETSTVSRRPQLIVTAVVEGVDGEPPTAPTELTASAAWPTEVDLNWTAATDNIGVTAYEIYRDGALLTTVGDVTSYIDMTALASTSYDYSVRALDAAGNQSDLSTEAEVTTPAPTSDPVIMAAGDQACDPTATAFNGGVGTATSCRQKYTSDLLVNRDLAAVLALGDIQYECGGYNAFLQSYDPTWGRVKSITYPVPGNHEYHTEGGMDCDPTGNALGYFNYFGAAAGDPAKGYYSFDVGAWHMVALNSNCAKVSCATSSAQATWLRQDLAANPDTCTLAFWHHPRFTSGTNAPGSSSVKPLYQALYDYKADVLLVGHDHDYERFALQDPEGALDPVRGIRQFVVGTGGKSFHNFSTIQPGSEARNNDTFGVLKLVLSPTSYEWRFVPEAGKTYTDTGSTPCAA